MTTQTAEVPVDEINIGERLRDVCEAAAEQYALSISQSGLLHPVIVRPSEHGGFDLVAGAHRLRAHELLDLETIRAEIRDLTDDEAEIVEIEENLFRNDLTCAERVISLGLWEQAFKEAHPEIRQGGDRRSEDVKTKVQSLHFENFDEIMGRKTGRSRRSNFDDLALFKVLGVEALKELRGSAIADNMAQLKALSKLESKQLRGAVHRISVGDFASVKAWQVAVGDVPASENISPRDAWMEKQLEHWAAGKKAWRDAFLAEIGAAK
jgi:ParB family chromosome partitioning protein